MSKITIIGCGALGSHVVQFLRNVSSDIKVIDFDRIESKNVMSQFHSKTNISKNKTQALQQQMNFLFGRKIDIVPHKLTTENVEEMLNGADLLIDCLDNGEARRLVQDFARSKTIPCLHGALSADGDFGCAIWDDEFEIHDAPAVGTPTCQNGDHLPFISMVSGYISYVAQIYLASGAKSSFRVHPGGVMKTSIK